MNDAGSRPEHCGRCPVAHGRPVIIVDPAARFGHPTVRGVSTRDIAATVAADDVPTACHEYQLSRHEVLLACWYEGTWGWRRGVWGDWADRQAYTLLAHGRADTLPDPPRVPARVTPTPS